MKRKGRVSNQFTGLTGRGRGRTQFVGGTLYQIRDDEEEKAGLCFNTHVSLRSAGTGMVNRRTLLITLTNP